MAHTKGQAIKDDVIRESEIKVFAAEDRGSRKRINRPSKKLQKLLISFASDNNAGVHPNILSAMNSVNQGHVISYGDDTFTQSAVKKFEEHFGKDVDVGVDVLSFGGTKNGMMFGEAVIFFKRKLPQNFKYIRKQPAVFD